MEQAIVKLEGLRDEYKKLIGKEKPGSEKAIKFAEKIKTIENKIEVMKKDITEK